MKRKIRKRHTRSGWEIQGDKEVVSGAGRADLGGLAHLLLKLSPYTIVLLNAQHKRLGCFLRLQLRLVRKERKEKANKSYRCSSTNKKLKLIQH